MNKTPCFRVVGLIHVTQVEVANNKQAYILSRNAVIRKKKKKKKLAKLAEEITSSKSVSSG